MEPFTRTAKPRNWTRKRINADLKARGTCQADLVRASGKSPAMVCEVVAGKRKSLPIATVIAAALGRQTWEIWPRLYVAPAMSTDVPTTAAMAAPTATALAS
jgi:lambda repressor-like predicted transcriptional regulator